MSTLKSLPHTPIASTASTITATMMAKAFQNNNSNSHTQQHKRGLTEMTAPPPTPTACNSPYPNSSSYLDCQSLQSSLKRVRLSSSPGELRLHRDLRHMVSSGTWVPQQQEQSDQSSSSCGSSTGNEVWLWHPPAPPVTVKEQHQPPAPHIELKKVESLRLRLTYQHSVVAWIQIPRMYPHKPPVISSIVYRDNYGNNTNNNPPPPISLSGSPTHSNNSKRTIQTIVVNEALPGRSDSNSMESSDSIGTIPEGPHDPTIHNNTSMNTSPIHHQGNTVVYHDWSPVQRLGDLLSFVITTLQKQHEELQGPASSTNNHNGRSTGAGIHDVSLTYSSSSLSSNSSWSRRSSNSSITTASSTNTAGYRTSSSSLFPGWKDEHSQQQPTMDINMMTAGPHHYQELASSFLRPNRFDVGYDRAVPPVTMDMDVVVTSHNNNNNHNLGIPQQVSMMDL